MTEMAARLHVGGMHLVRVGVDIGLRAGAQPEAEPVEVILAAGRAVPAGTQTQVDPMHVVLGGEHRQWFRQRRPVCSANVWKPAETLPMYVALPNTMPSAASRISQSTSVIRSTAMTVTSAPASRDPAATVSASSAVCPKPEC